MEKSALCNKDRYDYDNPPNGDEEKIAKANEIDSMEKSPIRYERENVRISLFNDKNILNSPNQQGENNDNNFVLNIHPVVQNLNFESPKLVNQESSIKVSSNITFGDNSAQENNNIENEIKNNELINQNTPFSFANENNKNENETKNPISENKSDININNISVKINEEEKKENKNNNDSIDEENKNEKNIINENKENLQDKNNIIKEENNLQKSLFEKGTGFDSSKIFSFSQNNISIKLVGKGNLNTANDNKCLFDDLFDNKKELNLTKTITIPQTNKNNENLFFNDNEKKILL